MTDPRRCGNCKFMRNVVRWETKAQFLGLFRSSPEHGDPIPGKGVCGEPNVLSAYPNLFYVTDMMSCSQHAWKEETK